MGEVCRICGHIRTFTEKDDKIECFGDGGHEFVEGAFTDPPAPPEEADEGSELAGSATPGPDRAKVAVIVERVGALLERISQLSVGAVYPGDEIQRMWIELEATGRILKGMGGTQLQREVINEVRRDHTRLSESLEVSWLGDRERRLP
ncbi:MAG: hypothetical protein ACYTG0_47415 [Planctomycetota bacterium]|jgi:hypothetical protein